MATDSVAGLQYKAFTTTTLNGNRDTSTLILYADSTVQNGLAITVTDSTNAIIGNCTCCVYNSAYLAQQDSCSGSLFQLVTNTFGKAAAFNIHATTYYTHCQAKFGNIVLKGIDTTVVDKARIKKRTIVLLTH